VNDLLAGATPARGAIEAKPAGADAWKIAESKQVKEYWSRYRQVLVTITGLSSWWGRRRRQPGDPGDV